MLDHLFTLYHKSQEKSVKDQILFSISQHKSKKAVRGMIEIAKKEQDPKLKKQLIYWLGKTKDEEAMKFLREIIEK
jgi:HEAT repeat protein